MPVAFDVRDSAGQKVLASSAALYYPPRGEVFSPLASAPVIVAGGAVPQAPPPKSNQKFKFEFVEGNTEKSVGLFYEGCIKAIQEKSALNVPEKVCEEKKAEIERYFSLRHDGVPNRIYEIIAGVDNNSQIFDGLISGKMNSQFMTKQYKKINHEVLDQLSITLETVGWNFGFSKPQHDEDSRSQTNFLVDEIIRYTAIQNGETVLLDTLVFFPQDVAIMFDCTHITKRRKLRQCNQNYSSLIWQTNTSNDKYSSDSIHHSASGLFGNSPSIFSSFFDIQTPVFDDSYVGGVSRFARSEASKHRVNRYTLLGVSVRDKPAPDYGFEKVEGARAQLEIGKLNLLEDSDVGPRNYGTDSRYAGDVQRCIVEVRNSTRSDQATGNVLSGIARLAGAGAAADILDTTNRAINTYDALNGSERKEVNACMKRKGH